MHYEVIVVVAVARRGSRMVDSSLLFNCPLLHSVRIHVKVASNDPRAAKNLGASVLPWTVFLNALAACARCVSHVPPLSSWSLRVAFFSCPIALSILANPIVS